MDLANLALPDLVGMLVGLVLTLSVFSYIFGDNALFRLAIHIFIGVSSAYVLALAWYSVIWPQLLVPLWLGTQEQRLLAIFPFLLGGLLLTKASPRLAWIGSLPMAYLVGVGVATAIGGAVIGTIFPQVAAAINVFDLELAAQAAGVSTAVQLVNGVVFLLGTLSTLIYFHFGARPRTNQPPQRSAPVEALAWVGQFFIAITFGALFAGVYTAALAALVERWTFIADLIRLILP